MSIRDRSCVPLSPVFPELRYPWKSQTELRNCGRNVDCKKTALLALGYTLRSVWCQAARLATIWLKENTTAGIKRLLKEIEHWEISSSEGTLTPA